MDKHLQGFCASVTVDFFSLFSESGIQDAQTHNADKFQRPCSKSMPNLMEDYTEPVSSTAAQTEDICFSFEAASDQLNGCQFSAGSNLTSLGAPRILLMGGIQFPAPNTVSGTW